MQGRQDQGGSMDRSSDPELPSLNGTSKHRAIPQRPPGMARLDTPPQVRRVPRPQRKSERPERTHRLLLILCCVLIVAAVIAGITGYIIGIALSQSSGAGVVATSFLAALSRKDYTQAYEDLGPAITIPTTQDQFIAQATAMDRCYGPITQYPEVMDSATNQDNIQTYTYTITRSKLSPKYQMRIQLHQASDDNKQWKITDYGTTLGPGQHAPACSK
jgi:hypothetical protein